MKMNENKRHTLMAVAYAVLFVAMAIYALV